MSSVAALRADKHNEEDSIHNTVCIQLPDVLSICSPFELRTNKHCKAVSQASEKWLADSGGALASMNWRSLKVGLLAAACYPTADPPQLRFITDVLSLLMYQIDRPDVEATHTCSSQTVKVAGSDSGHNIFSL